MASPSSTVARVMRKLSRALAGLEKARTSEGATRLEPSVVEGRRMSREFLEVERMAGRYPLCRKDGRKIRADFRAWANVLPGLHVSALATPALVRRRRAKARRAAR
jgi:hypothetical protein